MTQVIQNYGDLKEKVQSYVNRKETEFVNNIPLFIALAERKIFRQLRAPVNERIITFTPAPSETAAQIQLPDDYLELKLVVFNSTRVLKRISEQRYYFEKENNYRTGITGTPVYFARIGNTLNLIPEPDTEDPVQMYYWADQSGSMIDDTDASPLLRMAPDLYLYGALLEAQPWLKNDPRITTWSEMFRSTMDLINQQTVADEYSGSNVAVSGAVVGAYGD